MCHGFELSIITPSFRAQFSEGESFIRNRFFTQDSPQSADESGSLSQNLISQKMENKTQIMCLSGYLSVTLGDLSELALYLLYLLLKYYRVLLIISGCMWVK